VLIISEIIDTPMLFMIITIINNQIKICKKIFYLQWFLKNGSIPQFQAF
jgi:hypothetical protein